MKNRIDKKFKELKKNKRKAFIAYITAGDPSMAMTKKLVLALEGSGVDMVELGIPFSDPLADGPTIQAASHRALLKGANLSGIFSAVRDLRRYTQMPIVFMTYYNPVMRYGIRKFILDCGKSGVDGVIIPDLPAEEAKDLVALSKKSRVSSIFLASPTSGKKRIKNIIKNSSGFVYYVSLTGVTGVRRKLPSEVASNVRRIRSFTDKPVVVGFGISTAEQAREVSKISDGVIIGSAIVKIIEKNQNSTKALLSKVVSFAKKLSKVIHGA